MLSDMRVPTPGTASSNSLQSVATGSGPFLCMYAGSCLRPPPPRCCHAHLSTSPPPPPRPGGGVNHSPFPVSRLSSLLRRARGNERKKCHRLCMLLARADGWIE